jgi:hypothetical protein
MTSAEQLSAPTNAPPSPSLAVVTASTETPPEPGPRSGMASVSVSDRPVLFEWLEKAVVYAICLGVLGLAGRTLDQNISAADHAYGRLLGEVQRIEKASGIVESDRLTTMVAAIGMRDMSILRSAVVFVGFIVVLMGCVFVLKGVEAMYKLRLNAGDNHASLSTASPGLILITAGIVLVVVALRQESTVQLELAGDDPGQVESAKTNGSTNRSALHRVGVSRVD